MALGTIRHRIEAALVRQFAGTTVRVAFNTLLSTAIILATGRILFGGIDSELAVVGALAVPLLAIVAAGLIKEEYPARFH